jgi:TldD protein
VGFLRVFFLILLETTFTGFCGAESGNVPVTATSPSLFVRQIETQKKIEAQIEKTSIQRPSN